MQRQHHQLATAKSFPDDVSKEDAISLATVERASLLSFPSTRFEFEKLLDPALDLTGSFELHILNTALLRELCFLASVVAPVLGRSGFAHVLLGIRARLEERPRIAVGNGSEIRRLVEVIDQQAGKRPVTIDVTKFH